MSDSTMVVASNDEFRSALSGLRLQADLHGLDVHDWNVHMFLLHWAEVNAQAAADMRQMQNRSRMEVA